MVDADLISSELEQAALFEGTTPETRRAIAATLTPARFKSGQVIFSRGDLGGDLYLIMSGRVKVSVLTAEGRELAFAHIEKGSLLGEIAMLDEGERTADATALTAVEAMVLSRANAMKLLDAHPDFAMAIIRFLCQRMRETDLRYEGVALHRIETRLARYCMVLCRQIAPDAEEGEVEVDLGMSQGELALLLGASRPKVNGALVMLEDQGAISRQGPRVKCNIEILSEISELI